MTPSPPTLPGGGASGSPQASYVNYGRNSHDQFLTNPGVERLGETGVGAFADQTLAEVALARTGPSTHSPWEGRGGGN